MEKFLAQIAALRPAAKLGILALLPLLVAAGYWYFLYDDLEQNIEAQQKSIDAMRAEKKEYEQRKKEYLAFRNEVNQLVDEQKELLRVLPNSHDGDIEQFIESVNAQVELSGLSKVASIHDKEIQEEMYFRLPVRMSLVGSFQQINRFFKNVGELQRIVTIADLQLAPAATREPNQNGPLKADFVAQTFRLADRAARRAPAAGAAAGGGAVPTAPQGTP